MPRQLRDQAAGVFHVYTHCVWASKALYRDDLDRIGFLRHLARVTAAIEWTCVAYCLMGTHYHLIVDVADGAIARAMHRLNLGYARDFNKRHGLRGRVQFAPYAADRIATPNQLLDRFAYVALNPVRAGIVDAPEDWTWSSYRGTITGRDLATFVDPSPLFAELDGPIGDARAVLRRYVEAQPRFVAKT
jgi:REP element-mobilizing transposase RayT